MNNPDQHPGPHGSGDPGDDRSAAEQLADQQWQTRDARECARVLFGLLSQEQQRRILDDATWEWPWLLHSDLTAHPPFPPSWQRRTNQRIDALLTGREPAGEPDRNRGRDTAQEQTPATPATPATAATAANETSEASTGPRTRTPAFSYARTLLVPDGTGWRAYLLCVRHGWVSITALPRQTTPAVAAGHARAFYQDRLTTLPTELQARFHTQVNENQDPAALLDRVVATGDLPRLRGVDWTRTSSTSGQVRVPLDDVEYPRAAQADIGSRPPQALQIGDRVLLAGDGFPDRLATVEAIDQQWVRCRLEAGDR